MKFIDICSGIGGFRSALEKHGHECVAFAEIDKFAKQSYKAIYDTENEIDIGDITQMPDEDWQQFKGKCDIIVGGTPCQSFSIAGKRKGFEDTRGTVFFSYVNAVKNVEPKYFIFENVKGLISHDKGNTIRTMLLAFDEIGYELDFDIFNSKCYGVPQNRERIYIVGRKKDESNINYGQQNIFEYI
ncbi:DNA cytosine methyltransferase [Staphylococcus haemolyticus]|uniref:DNA cytosine methyltransferase n=2 Tax=Staphylococcus haemolyticus TaxID=1283 RepID=UPI00069D2424|nr:DNA (cytosine-5-)-methyltransferase [Staphylococcus haemolyticus]